MHCCPDCFVDYFLQLEIRSKSEKQGVCDFCGKASKSLINTNQLIDRFEPLLALYQVDPAGESLLDLLQSDWNIFQPFSKRKQEVLLHQVSGNTINSKKLYSGRYLQDKSNIEKWKNFREELKHHNRFFPKDAPNIDHLMPFSKYIGRKILVGEPNLFRARISNTDVPLSITEMGKPPEKITLNGRANPLGISYLYVASDYETAIAEIKPNKGEKVSIAEYEIVSVLELADLRDPKESISPFQLNDDNELELIYKNMPYLTMLGYELSKPIIPQEINLEYLPSQYLCEIIKQIGYHGIIYKSSVGVGSNFVIFNDEKLNALNCSIYEIIDTKVFSRKLINEKN